MLRSLAAGRMLTRRPRPALRRPMSDGPSSFEDQLDTTLEKLKERVPSMEGIKRQAVYQMNLARNDLAMQNAEKAVVLAAVALGGISFGNTWVTTKYEKALARSK